MSLVELILAGDLRTQAYYDAVNEAGETDVEAVLALTSHGDPEVRRAAVATLPTILHGESPADALVEAVIALAADPDRHVRDWACFTLGTQWREVDTPDLRDVLAARVDDIDRHARSEALVGLAYRHDPRAYPVVRAALERPSSALWMLELVAAGALSDPRLHELVLRHQAGWDDAESEATADAVRRLTDPDGPGDDILDGVARLYRNRAHGRPDGEDDLAAWHTMALAVEIAPRRAKEFLDAVSARLGGDELAHEELHLRSALAQDANDAD